MKIAEYVRQSFQRLSQNDLLSLNEIERLTEAKYSKDVFKVIYPILKEHKEDVSKSELLDIRGERSGKLKQRYLSTQTYLLKGKRYYLCNHWIKDTSRSYFDKWLSRFE